MNKQQEKEVRPTYTIITSEKRRQLTNAFLSSEFYQKVFEPHVKKMIASCDSISEIDQNNIEKSYHKLKNKADLYRGLINKFKEWSTKNYKNEEVKKNG